MISLALVLAACGEMAPAKEEIRDRTNAPCATAWASSASPHGLPAISRLGLTPNRVHSDVKLAGEPECSGDEPTLTDGLRADAGPAAWWALSAPMQVPPVVARVPLVQRIPPPPQTVPNVERWRSLVEQYFPAHAVEEALRVMTCESGGDPHAYNAGNYGLMQISYVHAAKVNGSLSRLFEPEENLRVAAIIYADSGWIPWSCRP